MVLIPEQKKLSILRAYPMETMVILLIGAITWLSLKQERVETKVDRLQSEVRNYLSTDHQRSLEAVIANSETMKESNRIMQQVSNTLSLLLADKSLK